MVKNQNSPGHCQHCNLNLGDPSISRVFAIEGFCCAECLSADRARLKPPALVRPMLQLFGREIGKHLRFDTESYEDLLSRAVYKGTDCGAWLKIRTPDTIQLGSIVEGCDFGTETRTLTWPFTAKEFWDALDEIEREAAYIWDQTHGCECCHMEGEWGHDAIDPLCKNCRGQGAVI